MTEVAAKKAASASAMSVIVTAFLTWIAANKYSADPEHPAVPSGSASAAQPKAGATRPPQSIKPATYDESLALRPLCDAVFGEGSGKGKESLQALRAEPEHARPIVLRCLVAAVPDPSGVARLSIRRDHRLDRGGRARLRLCARTMAPAMVRTTPHTPARRSPPTRKASRGAGTIRRRSRPPRRPSRSRATRASLFSAERGSHPARRASVTDLLLVFLDHRDADARSRSPRPDASSQACRGTPRRRVKPAYSRTRRVNIVAPCFSGSMPSLRDALRDWLASINDAETGRYDIEILSGTASAFAKAEFLESDQGRPFQEAQRR